MEIHEHSLINYPLVKILFMTKRMKAKSKETKANIKFNETNCINLLVITMVFTQYSNIAQ